MALLTKLQQDAPLLALMPDNAWFAEAPSGKTRFVIVTLIALNDTRVFEGRAFESALYSVEARARTDTAGNVQAAFARFDELLDPQPPLPPATLEIPGYGLMAIYRETYEETVEVDDVDHSIRWNRCGGQYRLVAAPRKFVTQ